LFTAVIERSIEDWSDEYAQRDSLLSSDIEQRLRHHAGTIANSLVRADVLAVQRLVLSLEDRFPALAEVVRGKGYDYIVGLLVRDLKDAAARDGTPLRDPLAVARLLVAGITGAQMQEGPRIEEKALHDYAQRVVDLIMSGRDAW
jgi:hypothetical protein